ncbi:hypothetical protein B0J14DRAFT_95192 [Halenospora varia]|nr:hypothetical protein B0J14DRAFT_95192 [Halenospora varia]
MVALGGITWPRLVPASRPIAPEDTSSTVTRSNSVEALVARVEREQEVREPRRSSEGDLLTHPFPRLSPFPQDHQEPWSNVIVTTKASISSEFVEDTPEAPTRSIPLLLRRPSTPADFSTHQQAAILVSLATPPTPPQTDGEEGNLLLDPQSPIFKAVDAAVDDLEIPPPLPDTEVELTHHNIGSVVSFNTAMRPLVQSRPDSPIGGIEAVPMKQVAFVSVGTRAIRGSDQSSDGPPRIEITSPKDSLTGCTATINTRALRSCSNFSEPCYETPNSGYTSCPQSPKSEGSPTPAMVTAPGTPGRRDDNTRSDFSLDGPSQTDATKDIPECQEACFAAECVSNEMASDLAIRSEFDPDKPTKGSSTNPLSTRPNGLGAMASKVNDDTVQPSGLPGVMAPQIPLVGDPATLSPLNLEGPGDGAKLPPRVAGVPTLDNLANVPSVTDGLGVPLDISGQLPVPLDAKLKSKKRKRENIRGVASKNIRKARRVIFKKPVLSLIVGRKLSGPTSSALNLIAMGIDIEPPEIRRSVVPVVAPVPI